MASPDDARKRFPVLPLIIGLAVTVGLVLLIAYLNRPAKRTPPPSASEEAKAYLAYLRLSDVSMQASENFMKQQVIEVKGKIADNGPRAVRAIEVYCVFYGVDGKEIHRERLPVIQSKAAPLRPGETRPFRLPFDAVPDGWNQAMPKLVIAKITFAT